MFNLPYELQLYIYDFDDNQYYKSLFNQSLTLIKHYNAKYRVLNYFSGLYKYHDIYYGHCIEWHKAPLTSSKYILDHSSKFGHLTVPIHIKPSYICK